MPQRVPPRTSREVRQAFVDFFRSKDHRELPSSSLVPPSTDPTVLLTTAGMQQMIPFMLGRASPPAPRLVSVQKCFRTTDIDEVGNLRNLTFFEMLGNFSIGDYFKAEAIAWAWEYVRDWLTLPLERVWITVHPTDEEAVRIWQQLDVPSERIVALEDNWWGPPGAEGPCGPDSELYFDRGEASGCGKPDCLPGCDCDRFLEFWNLVFMQYFQDRDGTRTPLPRPNIDTGMGLERTTMLMLGVESVYETDLFRPVMDAAAELAGVAYGRDCSTDYALRVIADHGRGMTFLAGDGVTPGPEGRGYVMRRVIRRAVRYGRVLGIERQFVGALVGRVIDTMAERYRELAAQRETIISIVDLEERRFRETLSAGEGRLAAWIEEAGESGASGIDGDKLFQLQATYGFPFELSQEILATQGLTADRAGFERAMEQHRDISRAETVARVSIGGLDATLPRTDFVGYEHLASPAHLLRVQAASRRESRQGVVWEPCGSVPELRENESGILILERSPFYPEGGGQVGDRGLIRVPSGIFAVEDTQDVGDGRLLHRGHVVEGVVREGAVGEAEVDIAFRSATTRHHTLTHLLHQALRDELGPATQQRGSLVAPGVARFDFNAPGPLSDLQRRQVQHAINDHVLHDLGVRSRIMSLEEARQSGALMIFGEKYGDQVRVVSIGDYSRELCGGTHVGHSAEVGAAVILRETGIGSGLRRVEVVAGEAGLQHIYRRLEDVDAIAGRLGVPPDQAARKLDELLGQLDDARREIQRLTGQMAARQAGELTEQVQQVDGIQVVPVLLATGTPETLTRQWDALRDKLKSLVAVLAAPMPGNGRTAFLVGVTPDLVERGIDAGKLMRQFADLAGGKGGGSAQLAKGSGTDHALLGRALEAIPALVRGMLQGG